MISLPKIMLESYKLKMVYAKAYFSHGAWFYYQQIYSLRKMANRYNGSSLFILREGTKRLNY